MLTHSTEINRERIVTDAEYKRELRRRCQTDILFLGRDVLGYNRLLDRVHGPVADVFVRKNPDIAIEEQDAIKEGLHLDPRGCFKSTLSIVDSVQWIICFPNVRICILTATKKLAEAIAGEITDHFSMPSNGEPTLFQLLFDEYVISEKDRRNNEFTAPNRTRNWREATVMAFSIETSISGWHFDVLNPDDVVDTQNSATPQGIEKVKKNYRINKKTLMPWGYINFKGTRYNPFDLYGDMIEKANPGRIRMLVRAAMRLKSGKRLEPGEFPQEKDIELLFPELLSYEFLKSEFEADYSSFMSQYMNDSQGGNDVVFAKEALLQATKPAEEAPLHGELVISWRFNYPGKTQMKYIAGAVGILADGRMWVLDVVRGTFTPSTLAYKVVTLAKKHGVHRISIEETPGSRLMESAIQNYAVTLGWRLQIDWTEYEEDDSVRELRIKQTEPLIASSRLLFSLGIAGLVMKELYKQFENFGMIEEAEIPDVVSRLAERLPRLVAADNTAEQLLQWEILRQRDLHDRVHGLGIHAEPEPDASGYEPPTNSYGLPDVLGGLNG